MSNVCQIQFMFANYRKLSSDTCSFFLDPLEWQVLSYLEIPFSIRDVTYDGIVINENLKPGSLSKINCMYEVKVSPQEWMITICT